MKLFGSRSAAAKVARDAMEERFYAETNRLSKAMGDLLSELGISKDSCGTCLHYVNGHRPGECTNPKNTKAGPVNVNHEDAACSVFEPQRKKED